MNFTHFVSMNMLKVIDKLNECTKCGDLQSFVDFVKDEPNVVDEVLKILQTHYTDVIIKEPHTFGYTILYQVDKDFLQKARGLLNDKH